VEEPVDTTIETPVDDIPLQDDSSNVDDSGPSVVLGQSSAIFGAIILFAMVLVLVGTAAVRSPKSRLDSIIMKQDVEADELLTLLSRSKMVQIIHTLHSEENPIRFTELKNRVDTSSTTLTRRLGELEDHNLVERIDYETVPPTVVYKLTESGTSLLPSLETFFEWVVNDTNETQ
jgi:DNA-binding HxlR family transcriptional regulator